MARVPTKSRPAKPRPIFGAQDQVLFEACERRLVLSAQLLFDVLGDQALELHSPVLPADSIPLESHLQEAHVGTGLDNVREQFGLTGSGQTVAVIDSGIAWDHVALGEGFGPGYRVVGGWDFTEENDALPYDDGPAGFHGTHVSGIIGSDDPLHPGVAPDVDLVALRVFNDVGQGQLSWVENALRWVHDNRNSYENPITTVNLSLGTAWNADTVPDWATLEEEFQQLADDGIFVAASAGNSFQDYLTPGLSYPAASSNVLPVASVDDDGSLSDFSQRHERVLAAPGSNIISAIPDHVLGRDGNIDDFSPASGTSMAAPYVAGSAVLIREAMEMTGWESINATTIADHLRSTADSVFETITGSEYDRLNLRQAIESLIPTDSVGDTANTATQFTLEQTELSTWMNHLEDTDVYQFVADANGTLTLDANSDWVDSLSWSIHTVGQSVGSGHMESVAVQLVVGQSYELYVSAGDSIGPVAFDIGFVAAGAGESNIPSVGSSTDLGDIQYYEDNLGAGTGYSVTATKTGTFTVQWTNADSPAGTIFVTTTGSAQVESDATWVDGALRLDLQVQAGQELQISVPGSTNDQGELVLANVLQRSGSSATLTGTLASDEIGLDLRDGLKLSFGRVEYAIAGGQVSELQIDGHGNNDKMHVIGSERSDKVDLRSTRSTFENNAIHVAVSSVEEINYQSGGGADRVYLYDTDTDDTLRAHPGRAELVGVGYRFAVEQVERIFIHATGGGQDYAYLYDSPGDDRLSVRPQFSSITGDGFFNYVRGFERVYAYASAGGDDIASLYDSSGDDRFTTSGASASIVGAGFSSFTRSFEQVNAYSGAGGNDLATLYGVNNQTEWQQGSDFVSFREGNWNREARGFGRVETYVASQPFQIGSQALEFASLGHAPVGELATAERSIQAIPSEGLSAGFDRLVDSDSEVKLQDLTTVYESSDSGLTGIATELQLLKETASVAELLAAKLHLPEERLLDDPELEQNILDEAFRQFDELF